MPAKISTGFTTAAELQCAMERPVEAFIRQYAVEVFGDRNRAEDWLRSEIPALGNSTPESLLKSNVDESLRGVLTALIQIDYGVVS
jgi:uncharacterized protein (DUF2384 family)